MKLSGIQEPEQKTCIKITKSDQIKKNQKIEIAQSKKAYGLVPEKNSK